MDESMMDSMIERAIAHMELDAANIEAAHRSGKELIKIVCSPNTRRGDIIKIVPMGCDEDIPEEDKLTGKVIAVHGATGIDPETMKMHRMCEAICAILQPGDITTEEEFAGLYGEDELELVEAAEAAEPQDPNVCSCGANREMCERNQNVFGGHLNE
jgi:hypothetical protein